MRRSDTPMLVLFTSGSTGRAKGVLRTLDDLNELVTLGERSQTLYFPCRTAVFMPINWLGGLNAGVFGLSSGRFTVFVDPTESSTNDLLARLTEADALRDGEEYVLRTCKLVLGQWVCK